MELLSLLQEIRLLNVDALSSQIAENPSAFVEPALFTEDGELAVDGMLSLPIRSDIILSEDGVPTETLRITPSKKMAFEASDIHIGDLQLQLSPFGWDYAHISATCSVEPVSFSALRDWYLTWFDPDDENEEDENHLYGVLHFMSDPEYIAGRISFVVDFGSAPVESFLSLFSVLSDLGVTNAKVA